MASTNLHQTDNCGECDSDKVLGAAGSLLDQCELILEAVTDADYAAPSQVMQGGTIGTHLRHTLDHYDAIVGRVADEPIEYDRRTRGLPIETDRSRAKEHIASLRVGIASLEGTGSDEVRIRVMIAGDGHEAVLRSTVAREVAFATHHGVHHVAMMKAIAAEMGVELDADIGKAPSTIHYERSGA